MTTIRNIVERSFREAGITDVGEVPEAAEFEEGLTLLQSLFSSLFGNELGEQLESYNFGQSGLTNAYSKSIDVSSDIRSSYVPTNVRLIFNTEAGETLYLHPNPMDGARIAVIDNGGNLSTNNIVLDGNGRHIEGADSVTLATNSLNREWFYRQDLGSWQRVVDLDPADISPLPVEFDALLETALALRLNPRYGATSGQEMTETLSRIRRIFRARYRQSLEMDSEGGIIRLPSNPNFAYSSVSATNSFNRGR